MRNKTKQYLAYIAKNYVPVTVTSLMKLSYLIDLILVTKKEEQISDFTYKRYRYGPFAPQIYGYLAELIDEEVLLEEVEYTPHAEEYIIYKFNEDSENVDFSELTSKEKKAIDEVLESLEGLGAKALSEIAYKTKPMKALGAEFGNDKGLNVILDLKS